MAYLCEVFAAKSFFQAIIAIYRFDLPVLKLEQTMLQSESSSPNQTSGFFVEGCGNTSVSSLFSSLLLSEPHKPIYCSAWDSGSQGTHFFVNNCATAVHLCPRAPRTRVLGGCRMVLHKKSGDLTTPLRAIALATSDTRSMNELQCEMSR